MEILECEKCGEHYGEEQGSHVCAPLSREPDMESLVVEDVKAFDYPDFVDAFISYGLTINGEELTEKELEALTEEGLASELAYCEFVGE